MKRIGGNTQSRSVGSDQVWTWGDTYLEAERIAFTLLSPRLAWPRRRHSSRFVNFNLVFLELFLSLFVLFCFVFCFCSTLLSHGNRPSSKKGVVVARWHHTIDKKGSNLMKTWLVFLYGTLDYGILPCPHISRQFLNHSLFKLCTPRWPIIGQYP